MQSLFSAAQRLPAWSEKHVACHAEADITRFHVALPQMSINLARGSDPAVLRLFESVDDHAVSSYVCGGCPRAEHCTLRRFSVRGTSFVHQPSSTKMWTQRILRFQVLPLQNDSLRLRSVHENADTQQGPQKTESKHIVAEHIHATGVVGHVRKTK